jgi:hypothetical protein
MTPQSSFMVVAPIRSEREGQLRRLLAGMNTAPGRADPSNSLIPFQALESLHFARFVVLDDATTGDIAVYGAPPPTYPRALAFLGDIDGDRDEFMRELEKHAGHGVRQIFLCCEGFTESTDLVRWMDEHEHAPAAYYVNWRGRTMRQVREEGALADALASYLYANQAVPRQQPRDIHATLRRHVEAEVATGRLSLTPEAPTPASWWVRHVVNLMVWPLIVLALLPLLLIYLPVFAYQLRRREKSDPELIPALDPEHVSRLAEIEDHELTNQFNAIGSVKPGRFRHWLLVSVLSLIDYGARHLYLRGRLARVHTIHAARWVFLDRGRRVLFASNYDGSLDSYMDDFINKVSFGLNLAFSNGVGYPSTRWLVLDGARNEQKFKSVLRRHQLPSQVWYNGHTRFTAHHLERNARLRRGLESTTLSDRELADWCRLL